MSGLACVGMDKPTIQKHQEFLAQQKTPSAFMRWVNRTFGAYIAILLYKSPFKEASVHKEKLWEEAQNDLNIEKHDRLPLRAFDHEKMDKDALKAGEGLICGICAPDLVYINENCPGERFTLLHEAAHHKYLDPLNQYFKIILYKKIMPFTVYAANAALTVGLTYIATYTAMKMKKLSTRQFTQCFALLTQFFALPAYLVMTPGLVASIDSYNKPFLASISKMHEYRADLEAAYASKCFECVKERADTREGYSSTKNSYLGAEELEEIAQEHLRQGNVCKYHKNFHAINLSNKNYHKNLHAISLSNGIHASYLVRHTPYLAMLMRAQD